MAVSFTNRSTSNKIETYVRMTEPTEELQVFEQIRVSRSRNMRSKLRKGGNMSEVTKSERNLEKLTKTFLKTFCLLLSPARMTRQVTIN